MLKIGYNDKTGAFIPLYDLPEKLEELSPEIFPHYCALSQRVNRGELTRDQAATRLAIHIAGETPDTFNDRMCENIATMASVLLPLFGDTLEHTHNPLPVLELAGGDKIPALSYGLANATARQFLNLSTRLRLYFEDRTAERLDGVIEALYPAPDGREQAAATAVAGLPAPLKEHLLAFIASSHTFLTSGTFRYYSIRTSFRDIFHIPAGNVSDGEASERKRDFSDALLSVAETGVFGPLEQVYQTNIVTLLRFMQNKYEEAEKLKKKYHAKK